MTALLMPHCTHCGSRLAYGADFCSDCGTLTRTSADDIEGRCGNCAAPLGLGWRYCGACGAATDRAEGPRSIRITDVDGWLENPASLVPEVLDDDGIELISRTALPEAPRDAPPPPPAAADHEPEPAPPAISSLNPVDDETGEPPISIYSSDRLRRGPTFDVSDFYPLEGDESPDGGVVAPGPLPDGDPTRESLADLESTAPTPAPAGNSENDVLGEIQQRIYRDPGRLAVATRSALVVASIFALWMAVALQVLNDRIRDVAAGNGRIGGLAAAQNLVNSVIRPALIAALAVAAVLLIAWARTSYRNVPAFGGELRAPVSAALWSWLIPGVNLVLPAVLINDAWRAPGILGPDDEGWRRRPGNTWVSFSVFATVAGAVAGILSLLPGTLSFQAAIDSNLWLIVAMGTAVAAGFGWAQSVRAVTQRQNDRWQTMSPDTPEPAS